MSIEVATRVVCDNCQDEAPGWWGPSINRVEARALAAKCGWTISQGRNGHDLCLSCTTAATKETETP